MCDTTIESLEYYTTDIWTEVTLTGERLNLGNGEYFEYGEGGMGNEGFIALVNDLGSLIWAIYFVHSNPFFKILIKDRYILGYTSGDLEYKIDMDNLSSITISKVRWRDHEQAT